MKTFMSNIGKDTVKGAAMHRLAEGGMVVRATAAHVTAGYAEVALDTPTAPAAIEGSVYSAVGTKRAWDGAMTVQTGNVLRLDNTGTTDFVAGDRLVFKAYFD